MKEETIGGILVSWRKKQGIFIADCANELNAPIEYLDAIENNFFSEMPNNHYAYNLIIKYAKFIHIPDKDSKKIRNIAKQILKITDQNTASRSFYRRGRSILVNIIFMLVILSESPLRDVSNTNKRIYKHAIIDISTLTPSGSLLTSTVSLAGSLPLLKNVA